jgi:hypothetical protein
MTYPLTFRVLHSSESVSNNRVKSGYVNRTSAPIDMVPQAGARMGAADGTEYTEPSLAVPDEEAGEGTLSPIRTATTLSPPPSQIPSLRV